MASEVNSKSSPAIIGSTSTTTTTTSQQPIQVAQDAITSSASTKSGKKKNRKPVVKAQIQASSIAASQTILAPERASSKTISTVQLNPHFKKHEIENFLKLFLCKAEPKLQTDKFKFWVEKRARYGDASAKAHSYVKDLLKTHSDLIIEIDSTGSIYDDGLIFTQPDVSECQELKHVLKGVHLPLPNVYQINAEALAAALKQKNKRVPCFFAENVLDCFDGEKQTRVLKALSEVQGKGDKIILAKDTGPLVDTFLLEMRKIFGENELFYPMPSEENRLGFALLSKELLLQKDPALYRDLERLNNDLKFMWEYWERDFSNINGVTQATPSEISMVERLKIFAENHLNGEFNWVHFMQYHIDTMKACFDSLGYDFSSEIKLTNAFISKDKHKRNVMKGGYDLNNPHNASTFEKSRLFLSAEVVGDVLGERTFFDLTAIAKYEEMMEIKLLTDKEKERLTENTYEVCLVYPILIMTATKK